MSKYNGLIIPRSYNDYFSRSDPRAIREIVAMTTDETLDINSKQPIQNKAVAKLVPATASEENQLADKNFVNSTVGTNTANYIYKTEAGGEKVPFSSIAELEAYSGIVTNNDYAFVTGTDASGNIFFDRYKANVTGSSISWAKEYRLNNSSFTAEQWAAIQSGITEELVEKFNDSILVPADYVQTGEMNPVTSNAVSEELENYVEKETGKGLFSGSYNDLTNKPAIDTSITEGSENLITSGAVKAAIDNCAQKGANLETGNFTAWNGSEIYTPPQQPAVLSDTEIVANKGLSSQFIRNVIKGYVNSSSATTIARTISISNFTPQVGDIVKVLFTNECYTTSSAGKVTLKIGTQSAYYNIKVCKDGSIIDLSSYRLAADTTKYHFWQANTILNLMWTGSYWLIDGNPIVHSYNNGQTSSFKVYANGYKKIHAEEVRTITSSAEQSIVAYSPVVFNDYMNKIVGVARQGYSSSTYYLIQKGFESSKEFIQMNVILSYYSANNTITCIFDGDGY